MEMISIAHTLSRDRNARYKLGLCYPLSSPHAKTNNKCLSSKRSVSTFNVTF